MIITAKLSKDDRPTQEQLLEVREAAKIPVVYDEDCPELSPELEAAMRKAVRERNARKRAGISGDIRKSYSIA